ncbi:MAG: hypothetical protein ACLFQJ_01205 [Campylobacterales bacterium]
MWLKWLPWRYFFSKFARSQGFIDPIMLISKLGNFAQPSEVSEPIELLRAGVLFHARGLINSKVIQQNLDWVWPYWVEKQFDPNSRSFLPRAFSITHINLTHRNWTGFGLPGLEYYPITDPKGLITPLYDGCSIDFILKDTNSYIYPAICESVEQRVTQDGFGIDTTIKGEDSYLEIKKEVVLKDDIPILEVKLSSNSTFGVSLMPYNPEGVSFIHSIELDEQALNIDGEHFCSFLGEIIETYMSEYQEGDSSFLSHGKNLKKIKCDVGMANATLMFNKDVTISVPLKKSDSFFMQKAKEILKKDEHYTSWEDALKNCTKIKSGDKKIDFLYQTAIKSSILMSPNEVYPGPYTYRRFWFRDAAFILNALISLGLKHRCENIINQFPKKQRLDGYFLSQEGEWDSNGQVLWIVHRYYKSFNETLDPKLLKSIKKGADWIIGKRNKKDSSKTSGLMPAGFSAEHFGSNDNYYWDSMFASSGLMCAYEILKEHGDEDAELYKEQAEDIKHSIIYSIEQNLAKNRGAISASPHRRMDSGAIGSLCALYPLSLFDDSDERILKTAEFLYENSFFEGCFFQDMIHSGINAYLSLHVAQVFLKAGRRDRFIEIVDNVKNLSSPTGQWPEAIHPITKGGCMGDGHHVWASAEWIKAINSAFVLEASSSIKLLEGIKKEQLIDGVEFGPLNTPYGKISLKAKQKANTVEIDVDTDITEKITCFGENIKKGVNRVKV